MLCLPMYNYLIREDNTFEEHGYLYNDIFNDGYYTKFN